MIPFNINPVVIIFPVVVSNGVIFEPVPNVIILLKRAFLDLADNEAVPAAPKTLR